MTSAESRDELSTGIRFHGRVLKNGEGHGLFLSVFSRPVLSIVVKAIPQRAGFSPANRERTHGKGT